MGHVVRTIETWELSKVFRKNFKLWRSGSAMALG